MNFAPRVPVVKGTTYALVLTELSANGYIVGTRNDDDDCAGTGFVDVAANGTVLPLNQDLVFTVAP